MIGPTETDPLTGLATATVGVDVEFETRAGADSTSYWAINQALVTNGDVIVPAEVGFEASDGNPIQPKFTVDVTAPDASLIARGAVIESLTSRDENLDNPTIAHAVIDNTSTEEPAASEGVIFPTAFVTVQTEQTPDGTARQTDCCPGPVQLGGRQGAVADRNTCSAHVLHADGLIRRGSSVARQRERSGIRYPGVVPGIGERSG